MKHRLIHFLILLAFAITSINAQVKIKQNPTVYPYGGIIKGDWLEFNSKGTIYFDKTPFTEEVNLIGAGFLNHVRFFETQFQNNADFIMTTFDSSAEFHSVKFEGNTDFGGVMFYNGVNFESSHFKSKAIFESADFAGNTALFDNVRFDSTVVFSFSNFRKNLSLFNAIFIEQPSFDIFSVKGSINLGGTQFLKGVDFRRANLDSVDLIYIDDHTSFPDGKFCIRWDQIKGRLRAISNHVFPSVYSPLDDIHYRSPEYLQSLYNEKMDYYHKLEIFYYRLRDNYLAQRDNASADEVLYELSKQRADIFHEWLWNLYGLVLGWGYRPIRFLYVVGFFILLFFVIWYWFYFELVIRIVDDKIEQEFTINTNKANFKTKKLHFWPTWKIFPKTFNIYDHKDPNIGLNRLSQLWHVVFFSTSVLLDIRFKKQWFQKIEKKNRLGEKWFLRMVTIEWSLGIALYVLFAVLVKGSYFEFVKGLLGI